jgi:hypothetical protein
MDATIVHFLSVVCRLMAFDPTLKSSTYSVLVFLPLLTTILFYSMILKGIIFFELVMKIFMG